MKIENVHSRELRHLIRRHIALADDLLAQAESAVTGRAAHPARRPLPVRITNKIEVRIARRRGLLPESESLGPDGLARACGLAVPGVLIAIGALHAAWALGWYWPAGSERELAEYVLSRGERERLDGELPPAPMTWLVAFALTGAAAVVRSVAGGTRSRTLNAAGRGVVAIFLARGLLYPPLDISGGLDDPYDRLDLAIYSPLCLALAVGTALVLRGATGGDVVSVAQPLRHEPHRA